MSKIAFVETTGRTNYVDSDWTDDDKAFFDTLDNSGVLLTYRQKMAIYNWGLSMKASGGAPIPITADVDGNTITNSAINASISFIVTNRQVYEEEDFDVDTAAHTLTAKAGSGLSFYVGQKVKLIKA